MRIARLALRLSLSVLVSVAFVWLSLRHADLGSVLAAMASADPAPLLGYLAILLLVHLVRALRWGLLLEPAGRVGFWRLNHACAVGFMLLVLLPLRLGELARPVLVARDPRGAGPRLTRSGAMASCVVERAVDGLAVGVLASVALGLADRGAARPALDLARHAAWIVCGGFFCLCVALALAFLARERAIAWARAVLGRLAPRAGERGAAAFEAFLRGLSLGSSGRALAVLAWTVAHWALHVLGFAWLGSAFGFALSPLMACAVLAVQVVGVMVPAGPGMVGTSQFFTQAGLSFFFAGVFTDPGVAARAAAYASTIWILQLGQQVLLGLAFWLGSRAPLSGLFGARAGEPAS